MPDSGAGVTGAGGDPSGGVSDDLLAQVQAMINAQVQGTFQPGYNPMANPTVGAITSENAPTGPLSAQQQSTLDANKAMYAQGDPYSPGDRGFWETFARALPLLVGVAAGPVGAALAGPLGVSPAVASALLTGGAGGISGGASGGGEGALLGALAGGLGSLGGSSLGNLLGGLGGSAGSATGGAVGGTGSAVGSALGGAGSAVGGAAGGALTNTVEPLILTGALGGGLGSVLGGLGGAGGALVGSGGGSTDPTKPSPTDDWANYSNPGGVSLPPTGYPVGGITGDDWGAYGALGADPSKWPTFTVPNSWPTPAPSTGGGGPGVGNDPGNTVEPFTVTANPTVAPTLPIPIPSLDNGVLNHPPDSPQQQNADRDQADRDKRDAEDFIKQLLDGMKPSVHPPLVGGGPHFPGNPGGGTVVSRPDQPGTPSQPGNPGAPPTGTGPSPVGGDNNPTLSFGGGLGKVAGLGNNIGNPAGRTGVGVSGAGPLDIRGSLAPDIYPWTTGGL